MSSNVIRFDSERNLITLGGRRLVFHCHHYNLFLQQTVADALGADAKAIQESAAAEATRELLQGIFGSDPGTTESQDLGNRLRVAQQLFMSLGFGNPDLSAFGKDGGRIVLRTSHYAMGRRAKWGAATAPVCHFAVGYWVGALAAAAGLNPERVRGCEVRCAASHSSQQPDDSCVLEIEVL